MSKPDLIKDTRKFVIWHLGRDAFAPHTGQDWPAWCAFVHLVQCWTHGYSERAIDAMRATLLCAQPYNSVLRTFVQVIPAVADWSHVSDLWPRVALPVSELQHTTGGGNGEDVRLLHAWERSVRYDANHKPIPGSDTIHLHGWQVGK